MADTSDSKSDGSNIPCGFESRLRYLATLVSRAKNSACQRIDCVSREPDLSRFLALSRLLRRNLSHS